jgi:N-acetylglucosaminyldiphosphoundecaprenol N-acetyl-beta-D-mannosaminyltransferase
VGGDAIGMIDRGKRSVLGVMVDAIDYESAVAKIIAAARARRPFAVAALAVHGVMTGALDAEQRYRLNHLDLVVPDGQPVRWALNGLYRSELRDRVYGPELMLRTCAVAASEKLPIFLFGGTEELLVALRARLGAMFPGLVIAGSRASLFRQLASDEKQQVIDEIRASGAAITFAGLGCPRQEVWAFEFREALAMPIVAIGAAFNFHAGQLPQAPRVLQDRGLEWLYRLYQEPRRLWRRYLVLNPLYTAMVVLQFAHVKEYDEAGVPPSRELLYG